jgi:hypothetical protein
LVSREAPVFLIVTSCGELVVPDNTEPKSSDSGFTVRPGPAPVPCKAMENVSPPTYTVDVVVNVPVAVGEKL